MQDGLSYCNKNTLDYLSIYIIRIMGPTKYTLVGAREDLFNKCFSVS